MLFKSREHSKTKQLQAVYKCRAAPERETEKGGDEGRLRRRGYCLRPGHFLLRMSCSLPSPRQIL